MQIKRTKQNELCYATIQQTLDQTKVSINSTWKEGLQKKQVKKLWQSKGNQQKKEETSTNKLLKSNKGH